jgi:hypothetical protein
VTYLRVHRLIKITTWIVFLVCLTYWSFAAQYVEIPMSLNISGQPTQIINVTLDDNVSAPLDEIDLSPGNYTTVYCSAYVWDLDGFADIQDATARIWHDDTSNYADADNSIYHYTNNTCNISEITGDPTSNAYINCSFGVLFYANYSSWNCTLTVNDTTSYYVNGTDNASVNRLIAVNSPNQSIEWGYRSVDVDYDADLNVSVFNEGNVILDLQLDAYNDTAIGVPANYSFTCDIGNIPARSIVYNDTSGGTYATSTRMSNETYINISDFNLNPQDVGQSPSNNSIYLGINVPGSPTINGTCAGYLRIEGMDSSP